MRRQVLLFLTVTLLSPLVARAQQPSLSETVEVRLLEIDVVVTDKYGNPVRGLTAADFEVFEDGRAATRRASWPRWPAGAASPSISSAPR